MDPAQAVWEQTPSLIRWHATQAGEWLIGRIDREAALVSGEGLRDFELRLLSNSTWQVAATLEEARQKAATPEEGQKLADGFHATLNNLINNSVGLARSAIERDKAAGVRCVKVRRGLRVPGDWEASYEVVYEANLPWFISHVMQSAFLGNPAVGETGPWISK